MSLLEQGAAHLYTLSGGSWLLEYGRGPVVTALPFALADTVFSTLDFSALVRTFRRYGVLLYRHFTR